MNLEFMEEVQADRSSKMKTKNWPEFSHVEISSEFDKSIFCCNSGDKSLIGVDLREKRRKGI